MRRLLSALAMLAFAAGAAWAAQPCNPCTLPGGVYHVSVPPDWDGQSKLRLFLYLHGWRQHGTDATGDPNIAGTANRLGYPLIAPDGAGAARHRLGPCRLAGEGARRPDIPARRG